MRKSKWVPLLSFEYNGNSYIIMSRINKKTGMLYFKQKKIHGLFTICYERPSVNVEVQFRKILEDE
jgi:hypothetical protein